MAAGKDDILGKMFEYITQAKKVLQEEGFLQPTVFATTCMNDSVLVLPILNEEESDLPNVALDLISKVLLAYNVSEYFVISESYHLIGHTDRQPQECINVLYSSAANKRLLSVPFKQLVTGEFFFGETTEIQCSNIEGTILELFKLKERLPKISEKEKKEIRLLCPAQSEDELNSFSQTMH